MKRADSIKFFDTLAALPQLSRTEAHQGCVGRTQIVGSLLHNLSHRVRRVWVLPVYESLNFFAPLYDARGRLVRALAAGPDRKSRFIRWRYHCASCLADLPGQPVIDFPLFGGPVRLNAWKEIFTSAQKARMAGSGNELRFVIHDFQHIPERQVLRHNPFVLTQSNFLPERRLAHLVNFGHVPAPQTDINFVPHPGDSRIRRILNI